MLREMISTSNFEVVGANCSQGARSHSAQGLSNDLCSPAMKIPLPPRLWITGKNVLVQIRIGICKYLYSCCFNRTVLIFAFMKKLRVHCVIGSVYVILP